MDTRETLLTAALKVLEEEGEAQFSTRAVCAIANVTAPTLYHHFGKADGLLGAAIAEAFRQFLESKKAAATSPGGRTGHHSEHLGHLLAVMQHLPRSYPDATW